MSEIIIIAAIAQNGVIGKGSEIPWYIKEDFEHFKELTQGHAVIMGSKTYETLPTKPLSNRFNVVLNFEENYTAPGTLVKTSFSEALDACKHYKKIFIIGGASVYALGLKVADKL